MALSFEQCDQDNSENFSPINYRHHLFLMETPLGSKYLGPMVNMVIGRSHYLFCFATTGLILRPLRWDDKLVHILVQDVVKYDGIDRLNVLYTRCDNVALFLNQSCQKNKLLR